MRCGIALFAVSIVFAAALGQGLDRRALAAEAIELSGDERAVLEKFLGKGVVGKALPGNPIADASAFFAFEDGTWDFQFTSGDDQGKTQEQSFKKLERDDTGTKGRYRNGPDLEYFLHRANDGSINVISEQDQDHGVVSRFSPPEPIYVSGMKPGDSKKTKIGVKVYDLSDLEEVSHEGSLDLTYSYLGAYEVTVPAGTFEAALIKWVYEGKVGPATIEDTQYCFLAEGAGVLAMVEKKNISAVLIYQDHTKYGKVLVGTK
jgi:hypothetical protein